MSEIMPMPIRARGNALATGFGNWLVATFWAQISPLGLASITWRFYFIFAGQYWLFISIVPNRIIMAIAWNLVVTLPIIWFFFKETNQAGLENIDLLFGERALGTLTDDLNKEVMDLHPTAVQTERVGKADVV
jgi:hypothetical protein